MRPFLEMVKMRHYGLWKRRTLAEGLSAARKNSVAAGVRPDG